MDLYTLYLLSCQTRVTIGSSGLCCCVCVFVVWSCEYVPVELCCCLSFQQQSKTYQSQIGRRREMQDSAEDSMKSRISQLELNVDRSTKTIVAQVMRHHMICSRLLHVYALFQSRLWEQGICRAQLKACYMHTWLRRVRGMECAKSFKEGKQSIAEQCNVYKTGASKMS